MMVVYRGDLENPYAKHRGSKRGNGRRAKREDTLFLDAMTAGNDLRSKSLNSRRNREKIKLVLSSEMTPNELSFMK